MRKLGLIITLFFSLHYFIVLGQQKTNEIITGSDGLHGYIGFNATKPPEGFGAGISFYAAVWPLVTQPLADFQIGLPGTWVIPENAGIGFPLCPKGTLARDNWPERGPTWGSVFQTIEGGLGYWAGNHFRYGPPKFSMNGTPSCYDLEIASPGWSFFYSDSALAADKMGIAQLSNHILVPPDGLTFIDNPDGKFLGYAWMALSFMDAKPGPPPTGDQSWTLFLNSENFKGPIAYYLPETWSKISKDYHFDDARGLDTRPGVVGGGAMEINTVPRMEEKKSGDTVFFKIPSLFFPVDDQGRSMLVRDVKYYSKKALYDSFKGWRDGKNDCAGSFDNEGTWAPILSTRMPPLDQKTVLLSGMETIFTTSIFPENVFGIQWKANTLVREGHFPQYFMQVGNGKRVPVLESMAPVELRKSAFKLAERGSPYISPKSGAWIHPGPVSKPIEVTLSDGSTVTYCWYRFIDQPSLQQFHWSHEEREKLQLFVERLHKGWLNTHEFIAPPKEGKLVSLDPALMVVPPPGLEIGYVPIVIGQK